MQLAATCALEHFTATLANAILADPAHLAGADAEAQRMWRWHAIEEIEHKAVAYDTWVHATRALPRWQRWAMRRFAMAAASLPLDRKSVGLGKSVSVRLDLGG